MTTVDACGQTAASPGPTFSTAIALSSLTRGASSVAGGTTVSGSRVALSAGAKSDTAVTLASSNPNVASVPSSETILQRSASHSFTIAAAAVLSLAMVTISASYGGEIRTATITVLPRLSSVKMAASSVKGGASLASNRLYFTGNVNADTKVSLTSSNPSAASVPSSEAILSGSSSHSFTVTASAVKSSSSMMIRATAGGGQGDETATLIVTP